MVHGRRAGAHGPSSPSNLSNQPNNPNLTFQVETVSGNTNSFSIIASDNTAYGCGNDTQYPDEAYWCGLNFASTGGYAPYDNHVFAFNSSHNVRYTNGNAFIHIPDRGIVTYYSGNGKIDYLQDNYAEGLVYQGLHDSAEAGSIASLSYNSTTGLAAITSAAPTSFNAGAIVAVSPRSNGSPVRRHSREAWRCESTFWRPFNGKVSARYMVAAERFERMERQANKRNGPLGPVGFVVLRDLLRLVDYRTGRLTGFIFSSIIAFIAASAAPAGRGRPGPLHQPEHWTRATYAKGLARLKR